MERTHRCPETLAGAHRDASSLDAQLLARLVAAEAAAREVLWGHRDLDRQVRTSREILRHAQAASLEHLEVEARHWLIRDHLERGDATAADAESERHAALAREVEAPRHSWQAANWRAVRVHLAGRLADVEGLLRSALEVGRLADPVSARAHFVTSLFVLRRDQGRLGELLGPIRRLARHERRPGESRAALVLLHAELDRRDEAEEELAALTARDFECLPWGSGRLVALAALADASATLGDARAAAALYDALGPYGGRNLIVGDAPVCLGSASRLLGRLACTLERWPEAEMHLQSALAMHRRLRARPLEARTRLDLGTVLLGRDHEGDRARAAVHLGEARTLAVALGMRAVARRARLLLTSLRPLRAAALPGPPAP